jgi:ABC-2 type transport system ATP-binding protein
MTNTTATPVASADPAAAGIAGGIATAAPAVAPAVAPTAAMAATAPAPSTAPSAPATAADTPYAIECADLHLRYPHQRTDTLAGISLKVPQGAICGLFGRNGAGKTSLMALLAGLRRPSSGSVRVLGANPWENPRVTSQVAFVYSKGNTDAMINGIKTHELLRMGARFRPQWDAEFALYLLKRFDVPLKKAADKMSQGQAAALRCSVGLASRAPLTIFDEAYLGMDAVYRKIFVDELLADYLAHPRTILFSTHYISEMERLFSEVIIIDAGRVLLHDDADALRAQGKTLQDTFITLTLKEGESYDK